VKYTGDHTSDRPWCWVLPPLVFPIHGRLKAVEVKSESPAASLIPITGHANQSIRLLIEDVLHGKRCGWHLQIRRCVHIMCGSAAELHQHDEQILFRKAEGEERWCVAAVFLPMSGWVLSLLCPTLPMSGCAPVLFSVAFSYNSATLWPPATSPWCSQLCC
jgi:hypothetical protein